MNSASARVDTIKFAGLETSSPTCSRVNSMVYKIVSVLRSAIMIKSLHSSKSSSQVKVCLTLCVLICALHPKSKLLQACSMRSQLRRTAATLMTAAGVGTSRMDLPM